MVAICGVYSSLGFSDLNLLTEHMPTALAIPETERGELHESKSLRPAWATLMRKERAKDVK